MWRLVSRPANVSSNLKHMREYLVFGLSGPVAAPFHHGNTGSETGKRGVDRQDRNIGKTFTMPQAQFPRGEVWTVGPERFDRDRQ